MANNNTQTVSSGGIGCLGVSLVLTVVFVVLKALGYIDWSWFLVFLPLIISMSLFVFIMFVTVAIAAFAIWYSNK